MQGCLAAASAAAHPVDAVAARLRHELGESASQLDVRLPDRGQLRHQPLVLDEAVILQSLHRRVERVQPRGQVREGQVCVLPLDLQVRPLRPRPDGRCHPELLLETGAAVVGVLHHRFQQAEQPRHPVARPWHDRERRRGKLLHRGPPRRGGRRCPERGDGLVQDAPISGHRLQVVVHRRPGHVEPQVPGGLLLQVVRLVDDEHVVVRYHRPAGRQVGEQQGVVDDDEMGGRRPLPRRPEKAGPPRPRAVDGALGRHAVPRGRGVTTSEVQLAPVPGARGPEPDERLGQEPGLALRERVSRPEVRPPLHAHVVRAALQLGVPEPLGVHAVGVVQRLHENGYVLVQELLLQVDRVGRDDDAPVVGQGVHGRRDQVGERLADARAGLDDEPAPVVDCPGHLAGHLHLLAPHLERVHRTGQRPAGVQHRRRQVRVQRLGEPVGTERPAGPKPLAQLPHVQAADPRPRRRGADARRLQHQAGLDPAQQVVQHPARLPRQAPHLSERVRVQPLQLLQKPEEEVLRDRRVLDRAVRTRVRDIHRARQRAERVLSKPRQEHVSQLPRVAPGRANGQAVVCEKSQVESEIVADEGRIADECGQSPGHGVERGRPVEVPLLDPGQALYEPADRPLRPGEALEGVQHPASLELDRAHLYDLVRLGAQPGRLQVDRDPDVVHRRRCIREQHHASTPHPTFWMPAPGDLCATPSPSPIVIPAPEPESRGRGRGFPRSRA